MAHADYNCCAICDEKQDYSDDARTKEEICTDCLIALREVGLNILTVEEFIEWVNNTDKLIVEPILTAIGYSECFYSGNDVDIAVREKLNQMPW